MTIGSYQSESSIATVASEPVTTEPVFMAGSAGPIFCIRSEQKSSVNDDKRTAVLLIPPFAEEMNRTRRFYTRLRFALLRAGADLVVMPDLYGTGDSAGDFGDATWQIWVSDLCRIAMELRQEGYQNLHVVGVRAGCLLIDEMMHQLPEPVTHSVFVQPENSGFEVLHHLLRVRVASNRFSGGQANSTDDLWGMLENAQSVSVNGYSISADLAMEMRDKRLNVAKDIARTTGSWIEVVDELPIRGSAINGDGPSTSPAESAAKSINVVDGSEMSQYYPGWVHHYFQAQAFWQLHECESDDELVIATARLAVTAG